ncbi:hypothetical protein P3W53_29160 [Pseudomonas denitrificans (nom. rej.)]|nr:hypothetical protein [Pseudomonas denitrificans (nom. rej.)]
MNLQKFSILVIFAAAFCVSCGGYADSSRSSIKGSKSALGLGLEGCYVNSSYLCTDPDDGEDCSKKFKDYLSVKEEGSGYRVELHSTQAGQNVCAFSMEMTQINGALTRETSGGLVSLARKYDVLRIESKGVDPTALGIGVCGVHADIDGLAFPISGRLETSVECSSKFHSVEGGDYLD